MLILFQKRLKTVLFSSKSLSAGNQKKVKAILIDSWIMIGL